MLTGAVMRALLRVEEGKDRKEGCDCLGKPGMGVQGKGDKTMMVGESGAKAAEGRKSRKEESRNMAWEGKMSQEITVWMGKKVEKRNRAAQD